VSPIQAGFGELLEGLAWVHPPFTTRLAVPGAQFVHPKVWLGIPVPEEARVVQRPACERTHRHSQASPSPATRPTPRPALKPKPTPDCQTNATCSRVILVCGYRPSRRRSSSPPYRGVDQITT
jgi:hypothetical protein